jgi:hypothetical protein
MNPKFEIKSFSYDAHVVAKGIELEEGWQPLLVDTAIDGVVRVFAVKVTVPTSLVQPGPPMFAADVR